MQVINIKKKCPYCKEFKVVRRGKYFVKAKPHWRQKYSCSNCNKLFNHFILLNREKIGKWDHQTFHQVRRLVNKKGYIASKFDNRKDKRFLSSRGIIKILRKGKGAKHRALNSTTVNKMIQRFRVEV